MSQGIEQTNRTTLTQEAQGQMLSVTLANFVLASLCALCRFQMMSFR